MFATLCLITLSANAQTKKGTVLLGAGSEFSNPVGHTDANGNPSTNSWTNWHLTPKVGYFIQDGLAIGAEIHFDTDDEYFPAFNGYTTLNDFDEPVTTGAHSDYTLTDNVRKFGVFARYYAARNLFMEVSLSSMTSQDESWETVTAWSPIDGLNETEMVVQERTSSSNVRFGMGYTLVWREHFAVEPYIHMDLIVDGEKVSPGNGMMQSAETTDLSGSEFIAGVNFSLFF